ncbi:MAG TPA: RDD family protein [Acidimicrobiales bacterium]|nr:RDD family protein [Acidimicrobiales bacterium]
MTPEQLLRTLAPTDGGGARPDLTRRGAPLRARATSLLVTTGLVVATLVVGWLVWSSLEWRRGRNPGFRLQGLRVVRRSDGRRAGWGRTALREVLCLVLLVPTLLVCAVVLLAFFMGASPPDDLLRRPVRAPWDVLSGTDVVPDARHTARRVRFALGQFPLADSADLGSVGRN